MSKAPHLDLFPDTKASYRRLRNYLAGRLVGASRDSAILEELIKCVFAHMWLTRDGEKPPSHDPLQIALRYREAFRELKASLLGLFDDSEEILLDPASLDVVASELRTLDFDAPSHDPIGDLYEAFAGTSIQVKEGQFFTPQVAVNWLVEAIDPKAGERIIDPACGAGGFLSFAARHLLREGASPEIVADSLFGVDKDELLSRLAKTHLSLATLRSSNVVCGDSISWLAKGGQSLPTAWLGSFDIVLTNPPFGAKIVAGDDAVRRAFTLAFKWRQAPNSSNWVPTNVLQSNPPPQVLFLERCVSLLKPGGQLGVVVPESMLSGSSYSYVVEFLRQSCDVRAVVGMPESLFKTSGKGGTHTKTCLLVARKKELAGSRPAAPIFFAETKWCGNDSRGRSISRDDLPVTLANFKAGPTGEASALGYWLEEGALKNHSLAPRYYDPAATLAMSRLCATHDLVTVRELVDRGVISITTGDEVGKLAYGGGDIPFVRTSDISNWEIKLDPKHGLAEQTYEIFRRKQDVREGDILMVRDGTYLIGACAYVSAYDTRMVFQSHLYKIRVNRPTELSPYLLLALLSSDPVQSQIKAKRVTQDIIDSLGDRIHELALPIPRSESVRRGVEQMVESCIRDRIEARELARAAKRAVVSGLVDVAFAAASTSASHDVPDQSRRRQRPPKGDPQGVPKSRRSGQAAKKH